MILPRPKNITQNEGFFDLSIPIYIEYPNELKELKSIVDMYFDFNLGESQNKLLFKYIKGYSNEEYRLEIESNLITVFYNTYRGALYALMSLYQLKDNQIPCQIISDKPDVSIRGYMYDISRDKNPKLETIKTFIDYMMMLKMNHFELYVEGFPLQLSSFNKLPYDTPVTIEEYKELEQYAKVRGIDLVPNINTFGHMTKWLSLDEYADLAECPNGYERIGNFYLPSTLNPLDPESSKLAKAIVKDVLDFSNSELFNINGDEPFELGLGRSKADCEKHGTGKVYMDFVSQITDFVIENKRKPLLWGDVLAKHPEVLPMFPKNVTVIEWGYNYNHAFEVRSKRLAENKIDFILAPGTSSWNSYAYRHLDMIGSVNLAIESIKKYGGQGLLMTDWGDNGHPQPIIFAYPGLAYSASESWTESNDYEIVESWLKKTIFKDKPRNAELIKKLGDYSTLEDGYTSNGTKAFRTWMMAGFYPQDTLEKQYEFWIKGIKNVCLSKESVKEILNVTDSVIEEVKQQNTLVEREILLSARLIKMSVLINEMVNHSVNNLKISLKLVEDIKNEYSNIWIKRNRIGGLTDSVRRLMLIEKFLLDWDKLNS